MKFRKDDAGRLKAPCASVGTLKMSGRLVTLRIVIVLLLTPKSSDVDENEKRLCCREVA